MVFNALLGAVLSPLSDGGIMPLVMRVTPFRVLTAEDQAVLP